MASLPADLDRMLHDLRGPLNAMLMHLEVLKRLGPSDSGARSSLEVLQQEVGRLAAMLPAAFDVLALEPGSPEVVNLKTLVQRALSDHRLDGATVIEGAWPDVRVDAPLLTLAIAHLVRNALEATEQSDQGCRAPQVGFQVNPAGGVTLLVRDWGRGLRTTNPRALIRLNAGRVPGRAGTGLVAVERIVRLHDGGLEFVTPPDGGAEVRLTLPLAS